MAVPAYYPYRSEAARDACFAYIDSLAARQWPVPSEERTVPTAYGPTFVRISGPSGAPPLVLLAGATGTSLMWVPNIEALSAAYRTYAVDQMNDFGRTLCSKPLPHYGELITWLDELFERLQLSAINLVGMSYGGALTAQYALHRPEKLSKVVLLAPGNTVLRIGRGLLTRMLWTAFTRGKGMPRLMRYMFPDMARRDPAWVDTIVEQARLTMTSMQRRKILFPPVLTDDEWRGFKVPGLFLVGEHEVIYSAAKAVRRIQRVAPAITGAIIPGAGHDLTIAQAAMVNEKILEFLREQPASVKVSGASAA